MFTHAGNARTNTGTPECLTAVYTTIETVGGSPVKFEISLAVAGEGTLFDLEGDLQEIELSSPGGGVLPYMDYIGMCGPKGYGFSAILFINRVSILADFGCFGHE